MLCVQNPDSKTKITTLKPNCYTWKKNKGQDRKPPALIDLSTACDMSMQGIMDGPTGTQQLMIALDLVQEVFRAEHIKGVLLGRSPLVDVRESDLYGHVLYNILDYLDHTCFVIKSQMPDGIPIIAPPPPVLKAEGPSESLYRYLPVLKHCDAIAMQYDVCALLNSSPEIVFAKTVKLFALDKRPEMPEIIHMDKLQFFGVEF
tara:strand:+ start:8036 stop:8644 length:609 start_codon:yes stop_codon:yes gene_type:complete